MHLDVLYSPTLLLNLAACLGLLLLCLFGFLLSQQLTRPIVFLLGMCLIGVGFYAHVAFLDMLSTCKSLVSSGHVRPGTLARLESYQVIFAYLLPFVSAAVGTNVISDALLKHQLYDRPFSIRQFAEDLGQVALVPVGLLAVLVVGIAFLLVAPIKSFRRFCLPAIPGLWRWTYLKALKLSIIARYKARAVSSTTVKTAENAP